MRMPSIRRNPADSSRAQQVRHHLDFYLKLMREAAYGAQADSVEANMDLMHALRMIDFFRGRAVELGIDVLSEPDMEEIDSLADDLARWAAKGHMSGVAKAATRSSVGRR